MVARGLRPDIALAVVSGAEVVHWDQEKQRKRRDGFLRRLSSQVSTRDIRKAERERKREKR